VLIFDNQDMIVGFNVNRIEAEKDQEIQGNLQINYVPQIKEISSVSVNAFDEEVAKIDFKFTVEYTAGEKVQADIVIEGNVLWNGNTEEVVKTWEESEELPQNIRAPLMNDLYRKLISESVGIADTLNMLPPIPTPQVQQDQ
jgi:outer membrane lipopolysaccharide assembly protein LptE/RlpB